MQHAALNSPAPDAASRVEVPIVRCPPSPEHLPVLVSIPHFGTDCIPGIQDVHYREPRYRRFPHGYADPLAPQIYGSLHQGGATVIATPISRLFVDVNRARDDFQVSEGAVRSHRGVVRTHLRDGRPVFRDSLPVSHVERRLQQFYDPFRDRVRAELDRLHRRFGRAVLVDAHTTCAPRLADHEVVIGTSRGKVCSPALAQGVARIVREHGFDVSFDVPGYSGGHLVRTHGRSGGPLQAVQVEINVTSALGVCRTDWVDARRRGALPAHDVQRLERCVACMSEVVGWLAQPGR